MVWLMSKHSMRCGGSARSSSACSEAMRACCAAWLPRSVGSGSSALRREADIAGVFAAQGGAQRHRGAGGRREGLLEQRHILDGAIEHDLAWRRLLAVVLRDERGQHLGRIVAAVGPGEEGTRTEIAPV